MSQIELENIQRVFEVGDERVHALRDITLSIEAGEYLSLMGPSGSGKSTLLNLLGLLDRPTEGLYRLDEHDVAGLSDDAQAKVRGQKLGFVFQFFNLVPRLTALENVELPLMLAGAPPKQRRSKVIEMLSHVGLSDRLHHQPEQLSGGQRQRVAIARAMVTRPEVILADEPTGNLDSRAGVEVVRILEQLNAEGTTLIVVTHDQEVGARASRRLRMVDGEISSDQRDAA